MMEFVYIWLELSGFQKSLTLASIAMLIALCVGWLNAGGVE